MGRTGIRYVGSVLAAFAFVSAVSSLNAAWAPVGGQLMTKWGRNIDVNNVLPEYPRPQMERS